MATNKTRLQANENQAGVTNFYFIHALRKNNRYYALSLEAKASQFLST